MTNVVMRADSYKIGHWMQYPEGTTRVSSYIASRGGKYDVSVFFGLQRYIKTMLMTPVTKQDIEKAKVLLDAHLGPGIFNYDGWMRLVEKHNGVIPVKINAVKEGSVLPVKVPLVRVENTDPEFYWLTSYLETGMLGDVWYGTTVATQSYSIKQVIRKYMEETAGHTEGLEFMLHDFGYRGVSSDESAGAGGLAHLINFMGTDTIAALIVAIEVYNAVGPVAFSVIASEHSTMCANANAEDKNDFASADKMVGILEKRVEETGEFQIVSAVADTYDVYRFANEFVAGELHERIKNSGGRFVVRPDSGDPTVVPVDLVDQMMDVIGYETNDAGYRVLPPYVRVLQGDGINQESITQILENAKRRKISAECFVFGMGGALLQQINRDTMKFAMKASAIEVNGEWKDVFKDPITDPGKKSLKGRVTTVRQADGNIVAKRLDEVLDTDVDLLEEVYVDGQLLRDQTFDEIREIASA